MKKFLFTVSLFFIFFCSHSIAQDWMEFDTSVVNTSSSKYFESNPSISKIEFFTNKRSEKTLKLFLKTSWAAKGFESNKKQKGYEYFNLGFVGDLYLLSKKYGIIELPEKEIELLSKKTCDLYYYINGTITSDSINLKLSYFCEKKPIDPEDKIFEKVEIGIGYMGEIKKLKQQLESSIKNTTFRLTDKTEDSILIFENVLNNKDSLLKTIELIEGTYSVFSKTMMEELIKSGPWLPPLQGGRPVKAYFKIFIRLNKDKSLTVAIPED